MIEARILFLILTGFLLALLIAIAVATFNRKRKDKLEEPKHRMLEDE